MRGAGFLAIGLALAVGCSPHRPRETDAGIVGPEGGVLTFDAAMLEHPDTGHDAARGDAYIPPYDAGQSCHGVAESCSIVGSFGCATQQGCYAHGDCMGLASGCYDFFSSFTCTSQDGCYWSSSTSYCSGSARPCDLEGGSASCASQEGCYWQDGCAGVATSCYALFTSASCTAQLGCYWD